MFGRKVALPTLSFVPPHIFSPPSHCIAVVLHLCPNLSPSYSVRILVSLLIISISVSRPAGFQLPSPGCIYSIPLYIPSAPLPTREISRRQCGWLHWIPQPDSDPDILASTDDIKVEAEACYSVGLGDRTEDDVDVAWRAWDPRWLILQALARRSEVRVPVAARACQSVTSRTIGGCW